MKPTDIMLCDWVFHKNNNKAVKVEEILILDNGELCINREWTNQEGFSAIKLEALEPIPLTHEIMGKNEFSSFIIDGDMYYKYFNYYIMRCQKLKHDAFILSILDSVTYKLLFNRTVKYVHEFQHVLRIFNLNIFADNFKI